MSTSLNRFENLNLRASLQYRFLLFPTYTIHTKSTHKLSIPMIDKLRSPIVQLARFGFTSALGQNCYLQVKITAEKPAPARDM